MSNIQEKHEITEFEANKVFAEIKTRLKKANVFPNTCLMYAYKNDLTFGFDIDYGLDQSFFTAVAKQKLSVAGIELNYHHSMDILFKLDKISEERILREARKEMESCYGED